MRQKPQLPFLLERDLSKAPFDLMKRIIGKNAQQGKAKNPLFLVIMLILNIKINC